MDQFLIVVSGLPRSGTSLLMQMLAAGGVEIMTDSARQADEDNPRGYLEFEPVKGLLKDSRWLGETKGKAIKIVTPLLTALPEGLPCKIIMSERDLDEVLDSQQRMIERRKQPIQSTPERRRMLKEEYTRTIARVKAMLAQRPATDVLVIEYRDAVGNPAGTAAKLNTFLGGNLDVVKMAEAVDPALHRNRAR